MSPILEKLIRELERNGEAKNRESSARFFKEEVTTHGVKTATVTEIGKDYFAKLDDRSKENVFALCEELWQTGCLDESFIACNWAYALRKEFTVEDFKTFERWVSSYVSNWASCDTLCNHAVGAFVEMYPEKADALKTWARSDNRWMRRASAVTLIIPAKGGKFLPETFAICDILRDDADDLVRKGYGWLLKAASMAHEREVFDYVMKYRGSMPRTALRYAIEKMPPDLKKRAMQK